MVGNVIDRGGDVAVDTVPPSEMDTPVARSGGWGNIAFIGAGIGLLGAMGGIMIGYSAFHHPAGAASTAQPAKASDRSVDDVMGSPNAQRAVLAGQLGQSGAPATDIFGRPIVPTTIQPSVDASGNAVPATTTTVPANGQQTPEQRRAEQARTMADAARRSPIMAFGSTGVASAALPASASGTNAQPQGRAKRARQQALGKPARVGRASAPVASERQAMTVRPRRAKGRVTSPISSVTPRSRRCGRPWSPIATSF